MSACVSGWPASGLEQPGEADVQDLAVECFEAHRQCEGLFREATALYGDANFSKANSKLNQIYASLR